MTGRWPSYEYQPSFVLGFHGCSRTVAERVWSGDLIDLNPSENDHDWLGHGLYFWEGNAERAHQWAVQTKKKDPTVVGAVIDLGHCLDPFGQSGLLEVQATFAALTMVWESSGFPVPTNTARGQRFLDCAVLNTVNSIRALRNEPKFDTVRAPFLEGGDLYPNAGFRRQNHIQVCVRDVACIKGYFRPKTR